MRDEDLNDMGVGSAYSMHPNEYGAKAYATVTIYNNGSKYATTKTDGVLGDGYRIILTWGEYPEDLDSHVEGKLSNGELIIKNTITSEVDINYAD